MIYFVRSRNTGLIKIGCSDNVTQRMSQLGTQHGKLDLLGTIPGGRAFENALHRAFAEFRAEGMGREWFVDNPELRKYIATYAGKSEEVRSERKFRLLQPIYHEVGINCRLYDLLMKKRQQTGFEDYDLYMLAKDTQVPLLALERMARNQAKVIKATHFDALIEFFKCEVNDFLQYTPDENWKPLFPA